MRQRKMDAYVEAQKLVGLRLDKDEEWLAVPKKFFTNELRTIFENKNQQPNTARNKSSKPIYL